MIDNPLAAMDLLDKLQASLPVPARLTPKLPAALASRSAAYPRHRVQRPRGQKP